MKRRFLLLLLGLCCAIVRGQTVAYHDYPTIYEPDGYADDLYGVLRVADNGRYLVGNNGLTWPYYSSFMVDLTTLSLRQLNAATGEPEDFLYLQDVSDAGAMVGSHTVDDVTSAGESYHRWTPCVMFQDSTFVDLPFPEGYPIESFQVSDSYADVFYTAQAKRISADGRVILGQLMLPDTIVAEDTIHTANYFEPYLWYFDPDSQECTGVKKFTLDYASVNGFIPYDMTDDGSIVVGRWTTEVGDVEPAVVYSDAEGDHLLLLRESAGETYWSGGCASCIDNDGNIYYVYPSDDAYYDDDGYAIVYSAKYNIYSGVDVDYGRGVVVCGANGLVVGMEQAGEGPCIVFEGDDTLDLTALKRVENISDDATIVAGADVVTTSYSVANVPAFIVIGSGDSAGITLYHVETTATEVFSLSGERLATPHRGINIIDGKKVIIR